jgi:hypothetical protein
MYMLYLTTRITVDPDLLLWLQAKQHLTLFQFTLSRGPHTLVQNVAVKGGFKFTVFNKYA